MRLFIAEKPSLGEAISDAIGGGVRRNGYIEHSTQNVIISWCFGHILELVSPEDYNESYKSWTLEDLPIIPEEFKLTPTKKTVTQFKLLKKLLNQASEVIHAGDPDREGQLLVDEVLDYCHWKGDTKRVLISDMNIENVKKALTELKPNSDYQGIYAAAKARSQADWMYGINLTRLYTLLAQKQGYDGVLSVGRVQTPILALITNRYKEHISHKVTEYYSLALTASYEKKDIIFHLIVSDQYNTNEHGQIIDKNIIDAIQKEVLGKELIIESIEVKLKKIAPPLPFSLVEIQKEASNRFDYSPDEVLKIVQALYETYKLTTYPRSDCSYLPIEHFNEKEKVIEAIKKNIDFDYPLDLSLKSKAWNDKKITAHHAIIPTKQSVQINKLSVEERNLYMLIAHRYLCQFLPIHQYEHIEIKGSCSGHTFKATGKKIIETGWKKKEYQNTPDNQDELEQELPSLSEKLKLPLNEVKPVLKKTTPPKLFTDASLLTAITGISKFVQNPKLAAILKETLGIGTSATHADIIKKLFTRNFVVKKNKSIIPTSSGISFINSLPSYMTLPDMTAYWEMQLSEIEEDCSKEIEFIKNLKEQILKIIENEREKELNINSNTKIFTCPKCKKQKLRKGKQNLYCPDQDCSFVLFKMIAKKTLPDKAIEELLVKGKSSIIKGFTSAKGSKFSAALSFKEDFSVQFIFSKNKETKRKKRT